MAITLTLRASTAPTTSETQTRSTSAFTPSANSLLLSFGVGQLSLSSDNRSLPASPFTSSDSLDFTIHNIYDGIDAPAWDDNAAIQYRLNTALVSAPIGGSPIPITLTFDPANDTTTASSTIIAVDIVGDPPLQILQIEKNKTAEHGGEADPVSLSVTLPETPQVGSTVIVLFGSGADDGGGFVAPTFGGQAMTQLANQNGGWCQAGAWYRVVTGEESNDTITCTNLGQTVGNAVVFAIEIEESGEAAELDESFVDNVGVQDSVEVDIRVQLSVDDSIEVEDQIDLGIDRPTGSSDEVGIVDAIDLVLTASLEPSFEDTVSIVDSVNILLIQEEENVDQIDKISLEDLVEVVLDRLIQNPADSLGVEDPASVFHLGPIGEFIEPVGISDSVDVELTSIFSRDAVDEVGITAELFIVLDRVVEGSTDQVSLSDDVHIFHRAFREIESDGIGVADTIADVGEILLEFVDSIGASDTSLQQSEEGQAEEASATSPIGISDSVDIFVGQRIRPSDDIGILAQVNLTVDRTVESDSDLVRLSDEVNVVLIESDQPTHVDKVGLSDDVHILHKITREFDQDAVGLSDSVHIFHRVFRETSPDIVGVEDRILARFNDLLFDSQDLVGIQDSITIQTGQAFDPNQVTESSWIAHHHRAIPLTTTEGSRP